MGKLNLFGKANAKRKIYCRQTLLKLTAFFRLLRSISTHLYMLQRVQTLFLLGAIVVNLVTLFVPIWNFTGTETTETISGMAIEASGLAANELSAQDFTADPFHIAFIALNMIVAIFLIATIFQYNNRKRQSILIQVATVLLMVEIVSLVLLTSRGPYLIEEAAAGGMASFGFVFPVVAVLLLWLGRRRVKADEALVKSVDRIR